MNIMGLGDTMCRDLIQAGYIKGIPDIYCLEQRKANLVSAGIIGKEKNTEKVLAEIEKSKKQPPFCLLSGFGIHGVGQSTARELMNHFHSIQELASATKEQLLSVPDIGDTIAENIITFFNDTKNKKMLDLLVSFGLNTSMQEQLKDANDNTLSGLTVVITGTLPSLSRKEAESLILEHGGKCSGSVSRKTSYVLAGEAAGSKLAKAKQLGIPVISEEEFLKMIEKEG